jgi:hypothetical protein
MLSGCALWLSDVAHCFCRPVHTQFETADKPKAICLSKLSADQVAGGPSWEVVEVPQEVGLHASGRVYTIASVD